jgi:hypothetical protein
MSPNYVWLRGASPADVAETVDGSSKAQRGCRSHQR